MADMKNTLINIILMTFLFSILESKQSLDFCQSLEANDYKIDYSLQNDSFDNFLYLRIGSHFWYLEASNVSVFFKGISTEKSVQFEGNHRLAFIFYTNEGKAFAGLWRKKENIIDWKAIPVEKENQSIISSNVPNSKDFEPSFSVFWNSSSNYRCFGQQKLLREKTIRETQFFDRIYKCFEFSYSKNKIEIKESVEMHQKESAKDFIVGFFRTKYDNNWTYNILYQIKGESKYNLSFCSTKIGHQFREECGGRVRLLSCDVVNTTKLLPNTTEVLPKITEGLPKTTEVLPKTTEKPSDDFQLKIILIIAIVVIVVVLIIIILIIVCLFCANKAPKTKSKALPPTKKKKPKDVPGVRSELRIKPLKDSKNVPTSKSETFSVQSGVDYSKPIPLNPNKTKTDSSESLRPTDLKITPK